jgi:hypothetical protein
MFPSNVGFPTGGGQRDTETLKPAGPLRTRASWATKQLPKAQGVQVRVVGGSRLEVDQSARLQ